MQNSISNPETSHIDKEYCQDNPESTVVRFPSSLVEDEEKMEKTTEMAQKVPVIAMREKDRHQYFEMKKDEKLVKS